MKLSEKVFELSPKEGVEIIQVKKSDKGTAGRASTKAWREREARVLILASVLQYAPSGFLDGFSR